MPIITLLGHHTEIYTRKKENHNSTICHVLLCINFIGYILKIRCVKQAQWALKMSLEAKMETCWIHFTETLKSFIA